MPSARTPTLAPNRAGPPIFGARGDLWICWAGGGPRRRRRRERERTDDPRARRLERDPARGDRGPRRQDVVDDQDGASLQVTTVPSDPDASREVGAPGTRTEARLVGAAAREDRGVASRTPGGRQALGDGLCERVDEVAAAPPSGRRGRGRRDDDDGRAGRVATCRRCARPRPAPPRPGASSGRSVLGPSTRPRSRVPARRSPRASTPAGVSRRAGPAAPRAPRSGAVAPQTGVGMPRTTRRRPDRTLRTAPAAPVPRAHDPTTGRPSGQPGVRCGPVGTPRAICGRGVSRGRTGRAPRSPPAPTSRRSPRTAAGRLWPPWS